MLTGHTSSQALHVVHAHTSSEVMRSNTEFEVIVISGTTPMGGDTWGLPLKAMTSPTLSTISRGSSGLPVACAGHRLVQRPHIVQASVSSSCFHVKSSITEAPKLSSSVSIRLGMGFMAPLGRSRSRRYMFSGLVNMWRSMVIGRITRNVMNASTCSSQKSRCQSDSDAADMPSTRPESGQPMKLNLSKSGRPARAMRNVSAPKPDKPITRNVPRIMACSGLDLMRIR